MCSGAHVYSSLYINSKCGPLTSRGSGVTCELVRTARSWVPPSPTESVSPVQGTETSSPDESHASLKISALGVDLEVELLSPGLCMPSASFNRVSGVLCQLRSDW